MDKLLEEHFNKYNIDESHGLNHAINVRKHAKLALLSYQLDKNQKDAVLAAAFLHDADDHKYFKTSENCDHARKIMLLHGYSDDIIDIAIEMIKLVSFSTNGNSNDVPEWMLIPRYADRLESIGKIGINRCIQYTRHVGRPDYTNNTPRAKNIEELNFIASEERYHNYINKRGQVGESTTIDHFYDKLLHITYNGNNKYFIDKFKSRKQKMIAFVLYFGIYGEFPTEYL